MGGSGGAEATFYFDGPIIIRGMEMGRPLIGYYSTSASSVLHCILGRNMTVRHIPECNEIDVDTHLHFLNWANDRNSENKGCRVTLCPVDRLVTTAAT